MVKLWFAKVRPDGVIPSKRGEDAGYDIFLAFDGEYIRLEPHETKLLPIIQIGRASVAMLILVSNLKLLFINLAFIFWKLKRIKI